MVSRTLLAVLLVTVATVSAGGAGALADSPETTDTKTITVTGSGSVSAAPDQTVLSLAVTSTAADAATARDDVATRTNSLRAALVEAGVAEDAIVTSYYSLSPVTRPGEEKPTEYRAVHALRVTLDGTDRAGELVDVATSNGATQVNSVQFTLSDESRADRRADALRAAMTDARADADVVATEANLGIAGVQSVSISNDSPISVVYASATDSGASTAFSPGPVSIRSTVTVTYTAN